MGQQSKHAAATWISYKLMRGKAASLGFGAGDNYISDSWFNITKTFTLPGYTMLNASIFYDKPK
ncbi:iron complex outermembrane recepter protein [bacterium A37T11]|nr:iron complex outermembrane recepter protein [bacterium A37T11]